MFGWGGLRLFIQHDLEPNAIKPLFLPGAIDEAVDLLKQDERLAIQCINKAELAWQRHLVGLLRGHDLKPRRGNNREALESWEFSHYHDSEPWSRTGIDEEYRFKWFTVVAKILRRERGFDLLGKLAEKSQKRLEVETILLNVFGELNSVDVGWYEWIAIQGQLEPLLYAKKLPV
jgi:hypothetical protein